MAERLISLNEPELERALVDVGHQLAYPTTPALAARVRQEIARRPARSPSLWETWLPNQRRLAVTLVALIALAAAVLAISPEARTAVAERLGLRGVLIREVPAVATPLPTAPGAVASPQAAASPGAAPGAVASPQAAASGAAPAAPSAGARLALGQPFTLEQVRGRVTFQVPLPGVLGPPDEVYLLNQPPGGQVALVYAPRPDLPQANTTGVGLLLTAFQGTVPSGIVGKGIPPGTRIEEVRVNGGRGYWIAGDPHSFVYLDSGGQGRTETTRLAGNVLLWEQSQLTLRLESALSKDEVLGIASSVR
jgi:hypothetical protein